MILDANGKPITSKPQPVKLRSRYDAAQTTNSNERAWAGADHLSPDAAMNATVRRILRSRARYETANNTYARGMIDTRANYVVGTGPVLQMMIGSQSVNRQVEQMWRSWSHAIDLAGKLALATKAIYESGEAVIVFKTNPKLDHPIKLDLQLVECDRLTTPWRVATRDSSRLIDGVRVDANDNPVHYYIMRSHPGDDWLDMAFGAYQRLNADQVVHLFERTRPEQHRGVPKISPALPLFNQLRRWTLAELNAAESAALPGGVIYTDAAADGDAADVEPLDTVDLERGEWWTLPHGWKVGQVRSEHPSKDYVAVKRELLAEAARCLNMPLNIALADSSDYNYASGRLDHQAFYKSIEVERSFIGRHALDRILKAFIDEAALNEGLMPQEARVMGDLPHAWMWSGLEHVDPQKEANATKVRLESNQTTLAAEYAKQGKDWEAELRQRAKEKALMRELELSDTDVARPAQQPSEVMDDDDDESAED